MPEGPMNVAPVPVTEEVEQATLSVDAGDPDPANVNPNSPVQVPPGATAHFPTHAPRLTSGGQKVLNALRGH